MKTAVVLAGGKGLRLYSNAKALPNLKECGNKPKPMICINNKPIMEYIILKLKELNFKTIYIVVGYQKELIMEYFGCSKKYGFNIEYIENKYINDPRRSGLSEAVLLVKDFIDECFMTILGDEVYVNTKHKEMIGSFEKDEKCECMIAVYETENKDDVKKNYSVKIDKNWHVLDLEEKPKEPWNNLVGCGTYLFRPSIFSYIEKTKPSIRSDRKELADTLKLITQDRKILKAFNIGGKYLNINYLEDLSYAEKLLNRDI
jgi:bifunctional UDP-N-acetylglucosamine pyrophosphorylase/glucosamine-1-phosphate N-acetyltransferase